MRLNSGVWEQNSNKLVAVLALRPELCFGSHHRKSILTVALAASEGQEFTSAFFNYVDVLSSWSLSSGRDSFGEGWWWWGSGGALTRRLPLRLSVRVQESAPSPGQRQEWGQARRAPNYVWVGWTQPPLALPTLYSRALYSKWKRGTLTSW